MMQCFRAAFRKPGILIAMHLLSCTICVPSFSKFLLFFVHIQRLLPEKTW